MVNFVAITLVLALSIFKVSQCKAMTIQSIGDLCGGSVFLVAPKLELCVDGCKHYNSQSNGKYAHLSTGYLCCCA